MPEGCRGCCMTALMIPLLICALVACVAIYVTANPIEPPLGEDFRPSVTDAVAFDNEIDSAYDTARSEGWFALRISEQQLSSWLDLEGRDFAEQHGYPFPFENLQASIREGRLMFFGQAKYYGVSVPLEINIEPRVDSNGHIDFDIHTAQAGGIPLPSFALDSIIDPLEDKLFETIRSLPGDYRLFPETLQAANGWFEVQGQVGNR